MLNNNVLFYLLLSLVASILLHVSLLPWWVIAVGLMSLSWRYAIYRGHVTRPHWSIKGILVLAGFYGIYSSYGFGLSIEAMVALLAAGLVLKPLEIQNRRDGYVLIFLCYLLMGLHFLFEQTPFAFIFVVAVFILNLSAQVSLNQSPFITSGRRPAYALATGLFLKSLPLAVFLFLVLPRLAPLWSLNISTQAGVVGLSESMSPGDVARLGRSDELAFRVKFDKPTDSFGPRYWRALVLDHFDGKRWSQYYQPEVNWKAVTEAQSMNQQDDENNYTVTMQASEQKWLFALTNSLPLTSGVGLIEDGRFIYKKKIHQQMQYSARLYPKSHKLPDKKMAVLPAFQRQSYLQLPKNTNPKSSAFAKNIKNQNPDVRDFVLALQQYFYNNQYFYTLNPGVIDSKNSIDVFLFERQKGFCAHFAGSVTFLLRSVGVPARVVLGYLGGEENKAAGYFSVYQYDAHAWVEVWIEDKGWLKIDPTAWVLPERIEQGLEQAVSKEFIGFSSNSSWLRSMRDQFNALNYHWNDWMINYKGEKQQTLLRDLFGQEEGNRALQILGVFFALIATGFVSLLFDFKKQPLKRSELLIKFYVAVLATKGVPIPVNSTMKHISERLCDLKPLLKASIYDIRFLFESFLYAREEGELSKLEFKQLKTKIKRLRKQL